MGIEYNKKKRVCNKIPNTGILLDNLKRDGVTTRPAKVVSSTIMYTVDEFNEELTKALTLELLNNPEIIKLKQQISALKLELIDKDNEIQVLKFKT